MIASLIAVSLIAGSPTPVSVHAAPRAAPCQAVPTLCLKPRRDDSLRIADGANPGVDNKMSAYRFDARPCRIIGNLDCPKRANRTLLRLGQPVEDSLLQAFGLR
ncbi:hypothetical protein [Sphingobium cloacae]|uniref:Uncharacterized protein n=1 Tax=Sphingobium cloacae TaxID=120107 RepID=A0A1E1F2L0_9SPHN|nr:hypothetical protein [Sphingobium cloacae]BAV64754.1 hypothetical protein SCLO_1017140 [Sphingobium cloacae]